MKVADTYEVKHVNNNNIDIKKKLKDTYETQSMNLNATNKLGDYDTLNVFL